MTSVRDIPEILDECLQSIQRGGSTVESCVAAYPDVEGLREMLQAASSIRNTPHPPMAQVRKNALEQQLINQFNARHPVQKSKTGRWWRFPAAFAATLILLLFSSVGLVRASVSSVPGDPLYSVKRTSERVELLFASEPVRPILLAQIATARLDEIETLEKRGKPIGKTVLSDMVGCLSDAADSALDTSARNKLYRRASWVLDLLEARSSLVQQSDLQVFKTVLLAVATATPPLMLPGVTPNTSTAAPVNTDTPPATNTQTTTPTPTATPTGTPSATPTLTLTLTATATLDSMANIPRNTEPAVIRIFEPPLILPSATRVIDNIAPTNDSNTGNSIIANGSNTGDGNTNDGGSSTSDPLPNPTAQPTLELTLEIEPTLEPTVEPTLEPTVEPTPEPTLEPDPTAEPTSGDNGQHDND
jgi:hypothetical protein